MKKKLLLIACIVAIIGCRPSEKKQNKINEEKQDIQEKLAEKSNEKIPELPLGDILSESQQNIRNNKKQWEQKKLAEKSYGKISELPLGFNFGMTEYEVNKLLENLLNNKSISFNGTDYEYKYLTTSGSEIDCELKLYFHNDELYELTFNIININDADVIYTDLNKTLDSTYLKISHYFEEIPNSHITKWFKKNQIIFLRKAVGADLSYINAPISKNVFDEINNELRKKKSR